MNQEQLDRYERYMEHQRSIPPSKEFIAWEKSQKRIIIYLLIGNLFFAIYFVFYFLGLIQ